MKIKVNVTTTQEIDVKTLLVDAGVRYWEDSWVNGEPDTEDGENIPCKEEDRWKPIINVNTGIITNWQIGKTADIHYKVCDDGIYQLYDQNHKLVATVDGYVPKIMCPKEEGHGDYIIMDVDENGKIADWKPDFKTFFNTTED